MRLDSSMYRLSVSRSLDKSSRRSAMAWKIARHLPWCMLYCMLKLLRNGTEKCESVPLEVLLKVASQASYILRVIKGFSFDFRLPLSNLFYTLLDSITSKYHTQ